MIVNGSSCRGFINETTTNDISLLLALPSLKPYLIGEKLPATSSKGIFV